MRRRGGAVADGEGNGVHALLGIAGRPIEDARVRIERGPARQEIAGIGQRVALRITGLQGNIHRLALQDRSIRGLGKRRRLDDRGNQQRGGFARLADAVADEKSHVRVRSGLVRAGRPRQRVLGRVEDGACGQIVGPIDQRAALRVGGAYRDVEFLAFLPADGGVQRVEHRGAVDVGDRDGELLLGVCAARVVNFQHHAGLRRAGNRRRPAHQSGLRIHSHSGRATVEQVAQRRVVRIVGRNLILVALAGRRRKDRRGIDDRGHVHGRHRQHAAVERQLRARGIVERHGQRGRRLPGQETAVGDQAADVDPPRAGGLLAQRAEHRRVGRVEAVDRQDQRREQVVTGVVGERDVVRIGLVILVGPAVHELDPDGRREIGDGLELRRVGLGQRHALEAFDGIADRQSIRIGCRLVERDRGGTAGRVVSHAVDGNRPLVGAGQDVVGRIQDRVRVGGVVGQHVFVERHDQGADRQGQRCAGRRIGGRDLRRTDRASWST